MWTHVVLEIYEPDSGWPTEGEPDDWIENGLVGYCIGDTENLVALTPLWKLLWWKVKYVLIGIKDYLVYLMGFINGENKRKEKRFEEMFNDGEAQDETAYPEH